MKKWSCFLIALFTLAACGKEEFEHPRVSNRQAIIDAHTAFYEDVVVDLVDGLRQHPDLPVEKLLAKDPEALFADLEARGIVDRAAVEQAAAGLYTALADAGYFDNAHLRGEVNDLLVKNSIAAKKKYGFGTIPENSEEAEVHLKNSLQNMEDALGTPCYDAWEGDIMAASIGFGVCMLGAGATIAGGGLCAFAYGAAVILADRTFENCLNN